MKRWMKKAAAVLLGGVLAAGLLSGCSRTIIEHQFHTEYVGGTGTGGTGGTGGTTVVDFSESLNKLEKLLAEHGIKLYASVADMSFNWGVDNRGDVNDTTIQPEKLKKWLEKPSNGLFIYKECAKENLDNFKFTDYIETWLGHVELIYEAFSGLSEEEWAQLKQKTSVLYVNGMVGTYDDGVPPFYVETTVTSWPY